MNWRRRKKVEGSEEGAWESAREEEEGDGERKKDKRKGSGCRSVMITG